MKIRVMGSLVCTALYIVAFNIRGIVFWGQFFF